jgi:predicted DNA-binding protein with PD1-like motif
LVGTLCESGLHLHISLSDSNGNMLGGHVLPGCKIYTTAEIVILELCDLLFTREMDAETGFKELIVTNKEKQ